MMNFDTGTIEKTQAMFADLSTRAKGAMEKSAAAFEDANAFAKGNIEAIVESSKIAAKGAETLGHEVSAYAKASFEGARSLMIVGRGADARAAAERAIADGPLSRAPLGRILADMEVDADILWSAS